MKTTRSWTGKKQPTNPEKKDAHQQRKHKRTLIRELQHKEWEQERNDFKNGNTTRKDKTLG